MILKFDMIKVSHFLTRFRFVFSDNIWKAADYWSCPSRFCYPQCNSHLTISKKFSKLTCSRRFCFLFQARALSPWCRGSARGRSQSTWSSWCGNPEIICIKLVTFVHFFLLAWSIARILGALVWPFFGWIGCWQPAHTRENILKHGAVSRLRIWWVEKMTIS